MMNWSHTVSVTDKTMHSIEQIKKARENVKSKMHDCDDFTQLNLITELAISFLAAGGEREGLSD